MLPHRPSFQAIGPSLLKRSFNRRHLLLGSTAGLAFFGVSSIAAQQVSSTTPTKTMDPWQAGNLDIHHISTGRGNSVLVIGPDGTSIMIDAGAVGGSTEALGPARPNDSRRPGESIGRYAARQLQAAPRQELDYFILTHFHGDHMGDVIASSPPSPTGDYRLTGVSDVAAVLPIRHLIDRDYPNYDFPVPSHTESASNYIRFARSLSQRGTVVEQFIPGSSDQIALQHSPEAHRNFTVQNLAANGTVWTGNGHKTTSLFPARSTFGPQSTPPENACSAALRISYGPFRYYIGGDLICDTNFGATPWMDVESPVSKVAGPVSVAALNHHGYYDADGPEFLKNMRARVYVLQAWHASHPALSVLNELYSPTLVAGPRDVFCTGLVEAARLADSRLSDRMLSQHGHVVVRASAEGARYQVVVLDDTTEAAPVVSVHGPYQS